MKSQIPEDTINLEAAAKKKHIENSHSGLKLNLEDIKLSKGKKRPSSSKDE